MERQTIESAINALDDLLTAVDVPEQVCQEWLQSHPVVLQILGFKKAIPQPEIVSESGSVYIPDFLVQRANGTWEIFEIKVPSTQVLLNASRRQTFYASFERYVAQCHEYADALDETVTRARLEEGYSIHVQPGTVSSTLLAGRSFGLDFDHATRLASHRTPPISICTYDDVRTALLAFRATYFSEQETSAGLSIYCMVKLHRGDPYTSNWLMDVGLEADRNRAALLIDGSGHLKLKVWDSNSQLHEARSHDSLAPSDYDVPLWLGWELAISDRYGYLSIQVDWRYCIDIRLVEFPFSMREAYVLGTDWAGAKSSWFSVNELAVYRRPLAFLDKTELRRHSLGRRHAIEQGSGNVWVEFKGHKWLASRTHPIHGWTAAGAGEAPEPAV